MPKKTKAQQNRKRRAGHKAIKAKAAAAASNAPPKTMDVQAELQRQAGVAAQLVAAPVSLTSLKLLATLARVHQATREVGYDFWFVDAGAMLRLGDFPVARRTLVRGLAEMFTSVLKNMADTPRGPDDREAPPPVVEAVSSVKRVLKAVVPGVGSRPPPPPGFFTVFGANPLYVGDRQVPAVEDGESKEEEPKPDGGAKEGKAKEGKAKEGKAKEGATPEGGDAPAAAPPALEAVHMSPGAALTHLADDVVLLVPRREANPDWFPGMTPMAELATLWVRLSASNRVAVTRVSPDELLAAIDSPEFDTLLGATERSPACVAAVKAALAANVQPGVPPHAQGRLMQEEIANAVASLLWSVGAPATPEDMVSLAVRSIGGGESSTSIPPTDDPHDDVKTQPTPWTPADAAAAVDIGMDDFRSLVGYTGEGVFELGPKWATDVGLEYLLLLARPAADGGLDPAGAVSPEGVADKVDAYGLPTFVEGVPGFSADTEQARLTWLWQRDALAKWETEHLRTPPVALPELTAHPDLMAKLEATLLKTAEVEDAATRAANDVRLYPYLEAADLPPGSKVPPRTSPDMAPAADDFVKAAVEVAGAAPDAPPPPPTTDDNLVSAASVSQPPYAHPINAHVTSSLSLVRDIRDEMVANRQAPPADPTLRAIVEVMLPSWSESSGRRAPPNPHPGRPSPAQEAPSSVRAPALVVSVEAHRRKADPLAPLVSEMAAEEVAAAIDEWYAAFPPVPGVEDPDAARDAAVQLALKALEAHAAVAPTGDLLRPTPPPGASPAPPTRYWNTAEAAATFQAQVEVSLGGLRALPPAAAELTGARERQRVEHFQEHEAAVKALLEAEGGVLTAGEKELVLQRARWWRLHILKTLRATAEMSAARWRIRDALRPYMVTPPADSPVQGRTLVARSAANAHLVRLLAFTMLRKLATLGEEILKEKGGEETKKAAAGELADGAPAAVADAPAAVADAPAAGAGAPLAQGWETILGVTAMSVWARLSQALTLLPEAAWYKSADPGGGRNIEVFASGHSELVAAVAATLDGKQPKVVVTRLRLTAAIATAVIQDPAAAALATPAQQEAVSRLRLFMARWSNAPDVVMMVVLTSDDRAVRLPLAEGRPATPPCSVCEAPFAPIACPRTHIQHYCSVACQADSWFAASTLCSHRPHAVTCEPMAKLVDGHVVLSLGVEGE